MLNLDPTSEFVQGLAVVALIVILFRDGLEVEAEMLQTAWRLPLRKLVLAMPITAGIVAVTAHVVTDLGWTECLLLGALLSPTDPVLSSAVVTNPRVPRLVRHSLNLESGLNDGLALPAVLAFTAAASGDDDFVWWQFVLQDVLVGVLTGLAVAFVASRLMPKGRSLGHAISSHQRRVRARVAFAAYGTATLSPEGNGFIAVFVAAIAFGIWRPDIRACFERQSEDIVEIVKLGVFVVFGAIITLDGLFGDGWAAVAIVVFTLVVARPVAVFAALAGSRQVDTAEKAFMAWFGPKGVATMAFALFVLGSAAPEGERIANIAALAVLISIAAHGLSDHPGSEWIARREMRKKQVTHTPKPVVGCNRSLWQGARHNFKWGFHAFLAHSDRGHRGQWGPQLFCPPGSARPVRFRRRGVVGGVTDQLPSLPAPAVPAPALPVPLPASCATTGAPAQAPTPVPAPKLPAPPSAPAAVPQAPCPGCQIRVVQRRLRGSSPSQSEPRRAARRLIERNRRRLGQAPGVGRPSRAVSVTAEERPSVPPADRARARGRATANTDAALASVAVQGDAADLPEKSSPDTAPFTGLQLAYLVAMGLMLATVGLTVRRMARR